MQAFVNPILKLLDGNNQYVVPRYQRPYSWKLEQCRQLWQDIQELAKVGQGKHFMGSVVYVQESSGGAAGGATYQVIDGQQRVTTLTLLLAALAGALKANEDARQFSDVVTSEMVRESFMKNRPGEQRFKLVLSRDDKETLMHVLDPGRVPLPTKPATRVLENYKYFQELLSSADANLESIYQALWNLVAVDISLDRNQDNPQLIFESLNSTGLDLTQSDLTRNYVLMSLSASEQADLYDHYWHPMEEYFKGQLKKKVPVFDYFVRDFVTVRRELSQSPQLDDVYSAFKKYVLEEDRSESMSDVIRDMHKLAGYYAALVNPEKYESDEKVRRAIQDLQAMELDVWLPLGLQAYEAWKGDKLDTESLVKVLQFVESYMFRRWAVDLSSAGLNKIFPSLIPQLAEVSGEEYLTTLQDALYQLQSTRRFPSDEEFKAQLVGRNLYASRSWARYTLGKLESKNKAFHGPADYTIEHIMPQNEKPSAEWREMLGENWQDVQDKYLHTLGNLTLTKYNPEMSDHPFIQKRDMAGGFKDAGLFLNRSIRELDHWDEQTIVQRAAELAEKAVTIWPALQPSQALKDKLAQRQEARTEATTEDFLKTASPALRDLFEQTRDAVLELHADMQEVPTAVYIAYKAGTNITDLLPRPGNDVIRAFLNIPFAELDDPQGIAENVAGRGKHGNGEAQVILRTPADIPAYIELVQQALNYQLARSARGGGSASSDKFAAMSPEAAQILAAVEAQCQSLGLKAIDRDYYRSFADDSTLVEVYPRRNWLRVWVKVPHKDLTPENQQRWQSGGKYKAWIVRNISSLSEAVGVKELVAQAQRGQSADQTPSTPPIEEGGQTQASSNDSQAADG
ncbi:DUF262 and DUF1524 domain-containing protein [Deinococcus enclensis]|uniref:Uncharacterized protein with ParB-like and HNH nuclease domain/predicted transport protein n=1 Tax=Deinococcus enclensis TaxID=1049582 RepID=A0ABT9MD16_9DEIO|nr:DUF262 and DUF1524 domain-containing protein [Deinococcus enclensis]MDP9764467.1 uncharacterized protein with ParB-like and HNH nuclease domain/predicted transport protein [Deinococcus enclensis]